MTSVLEKQINPEPLKAEPEISKSRIRFWILMAGFMALVFVRNFFKIEYPIVILLAYVCVMALFADRDEIVALAVSFIPFSSAFQYRYALLALMVIYALKFFEDLRKINLFAFIPVALMMVWEATHALLGAFSITSYLQGFSELLFLSFIMALPKKTFDYSFISRVLAITSIFCFSVSLLKLLQETNYDFRAIFLDGNYRFGINDENASSYVLNYNSNAAGLICNMSILGLLLRSVKHKIKALDIALIFVLVVFGLLTISRSFIICLALVAVLYIVSAFKGVKKKAIGLISIVAICAVIVIGVNIFAPYLFNNLLDRFGAEDVTGGRADLMTLYNNYISASPQNMFFGTGLQDILIKVNTNGNYAISGVPHNAIQELLLVWGVLGIVIFTYLVVLMIRKSNVGIKRKLVNYTPLILIFVMIQSGQLITSGQKLIMLLFAYVVLCTDMVKDKKGGQI